METQSAFKSVGNRIVNRPSSLFFGLAFVVIGIVAILTNTDSNADLVLLTQVVFVGLGAALIASILTRAFR